MHIQTAKAQFGCQPARFNIKLGFPPNIDFEVRQQPALRAQGSEFRRPH